MLCVFFCEHNNKTCDDMMKYVKVYASIWWEKNQLKILRVNVVECPEISKRWEVHVDDIPAFVFFKNGMAFKKLYGKDSIKQ